MNQIYFCFSVVVLAIALSVGLISGIYFRPPEIHSDQEIYRFAAGVFAGVILFILGIIFILKKTGHKEKIIKKLAEKKEKKDEKEK
ncbi:MAG: hypothetical protein Q8O59_02715 [bacterium]|nr:hypothetical protein [bacterium]